MAKYKICKFVNGNEEEWYQVMKRGWLYWYYMYGYKGGAPEFSPCKVVSTFFTIEQAQDYIKYWYYMYGYKGGAPEFSPCKVVSTFFTIEQAQDYIKQDISYSQKNKIKKVECFDYVP